ARAPATPSSRNGRASSGGPSSWRPAPAGARSSSWTASTRRCATTTARTPSARTCCWRGGWARRGGGAPPPPPRPAPPPPARPAPEGGGGASGISSWDMHGGHMGMGNAFGAGSYGMGWCLPRLDEALAALIADLEERGLLERTLVVVVGEFGRSPRISTQGQPGRLHWPDCFSAILAGAGVRGGAVYGASDKIGAYV